MNFWIVCFGRLPHMLHAAAVEVLRVCRCGCVCVERTPHLNLFGETDYNKVSYFSLQGNRSQLSEELGAEETAIINC